MSSVLFHRKRRTMTFDAVAERLIGEDLSDEEHRRIIERYVKEAGSLNAG